MFMSGNIRKLFHILNNFYCYSLFSFWRLWDLFIQLYAPIIISGTFSKAYPRKSPKYPPAFPVNRECFCLHTIQYFTNK